MRFTLEGMTRNWVLLLVKDDVGGKATLLHQEEGDADVIERESRELRSGAPP